MMSQEVNSDQKRVRSTFNIRQWDEPVWRNFPCHESFEATLIGGVPQAYLQVPCGVDPDTITLAWSDHQRVVNYSKRGRCGSGANGAEPLRQTFAGVNTDTFPSRAGATVGHCRTHCTSKSAQDTPYLLPEPAGVTRDYNTNEVRIESLEQEYEISRNCNAILQKQVEVMKKMIGDQDRLIDWLKMEVQTLESKVTTLRAAEADTDVRPAGRRSKTPLLPASNLGQCAYSEGIVAEYELCVERDRPDQLSTHRPGHVDLEKVTTTPIRRSEDLASSALEVQQQLMAAKQPPAAEVAPASIHLPTARENPARGILPEAPDGGKVDYYARSEQAESVGDAGVRGREWPLLTPADCTLSPTMLTTIRATLSDKVRRRPRKIRRCVEGTSVVSEASGGMSTVRRDQEGSCGAANDARRGAAVDTITTPSPAHPLGDFWADDFSPSLATKTHCPKTSVGGVPTLLCSAPAFSAPSPSSHLAREHQAVSSLKSRHDSAQGETTKGDVSTTVCPSRELCSCLAWTSDRKISDQSPYGAMTILQNKQGGNLHHRAKGHDWMLRKTRRQLPVAFTTSEENTLKGITSNENKSAGVQDKVDGEQLISFACSSSSSPTRNDPAGGATSTTVSSAIPLLTHVNEANGHSEARRSHATTCAYCDIPPTDDEAIGLCDECPRMFCAACSQNVLHRGSSLIGKTGAGARVSPGTSEDDFSIGECPWCTRDGDREFSPPPDGAEPMRHLLDELMRHDLSRCFRGPVDVEEHPDYLESIGRDKMMDLGTMISKMDNRKYPRRRGPGMFWEDLNRIWRNCRRFAGCDEIGRPHDDTVVPGIVRCALILEAMSKRYHSAHISDPQENEWPESAWDFYRHKMCQKNEELRLKQVKRRPHGRASGARHGMQGVKLTHDSSSTCATITATFTPSRVDTTSSEPQVMKDSDVLACSPVERVQIVRKKARTENLDTTKQGSVAPSTQSSGVNTHSDASKGDLVVIGSPSAVWKRPRWGPLDELCDAAASFVQKR